MLASPLPDAHMSDATVAIQMYYQNSFSACQPHVVLCLAFAVALLQPFDLAFLKNAVRI